MAAVSRFVLLIAAFTVFVASATAATDPRLAYLQKTLKADMVATFKKQAPSLKITTVTCKLPTDGVTSRCKAFFLAGGKVKGYYPVAAKLQDLGGKLHWTASSPKCWDTAKKRYVAC
jgi:hypothetical protein